jgi:ascorbate-specific PTS system EIIC-type component UlaA
MSIYILTSNLSILDLANNTLYSIYRNIRAVFSIFTIINIVIVIIFINKLKEINCECSEDIVREVYWIYNIVQACYFAIAFLIIIVGMLMLFSSSLAKKH